MKIDEGCINHNAIMVIKEITLAPVKLAEQESIDRNAINLMMLGAISGVLDLTDALKEVLKA